MVEGFGLGVTKYMLKLGLASPNRGGSVNV